MKILFTGASSFTGFWFVQELAKGGHEVVAPLRAHYETYSGVRKERIDLLKGICELHFGMSFGSDPFVELVKGEKKWDLFCHHAAEVSGYKSPSFDPVAALANNTHNVQAILGLHNFSKMILTGSVFEPGEGSGSDIARAVSPYGLSKGLTSLYFQYYAAHMRLGKFVIPNPFGPYEEERFTTYLATCWLAKEQAVVNTPEYVRDNVPVTLLAKGFRHFAEHLPDAPGYCDFHPSFYAESQGNFVKRFAKELEQRFELPCKFELKAHPMLIEPKIRINHDVLNPAQLNWSEKESFDQLAAYYQKRIAVCPTP